MTAAKYSQPFAGGNVGDVGEPDLVRSGGGKVATDQVRCDRQAVPAVGSADHDAAEPYGPDVNNGAAKGGFLTRSRRRSRLGRDRAAPDGHPYKSGEPRIILVDRRVCQNHAEEPSLNVVVNLVHHHWRTRINSERVNLRKASVRSAWIALTTEPFHWPPAPRTDSRAERYGPALHHLKGAGPYRARRTKLVCLKAIAPDG